MHVKAAIGNNMNGKEVMALLLDRRGDQITLASGKGYTLVMDSNTG